MSDDQWFTKYIDSMEQRLDQRLESLETKMDTILKDKYKIMGGYIVIAAVTGTLIQILIAKYGHQ